MKPRAFDLPDFFLCVSVRSGKVAGVFSEPLDKKLHGAVNAVLRGMFSHLFHLGQKEF